MSDEHPHVHNDHRHSICGTDGTLLNEGSVATAWCVGLCAQDAQIARLSSALEAADELADEATRTCSNEMADALNKGYLTWSDATRALNWTVSHFRTARAATKELREPHDR